jgi:hypothetical protein
MGVLRFRVFDALLFFFMPVSFCTSSALQNSAVNATPQWYRFVGFLLNDGSVAIVATWM